MRSTVAGAKPEELADDTVSGRVDEAHGDRGVDLCDVLQVIQAPVVAGQLEQHLRALGSAAARQAMPIQFNNAGGGNVVGYNYADNEWSLDSSSGDQFQGTSIDIHCTFLHIEC